VQSWRYKKKTQNTD